MRRTWQWLISLAISLIAFGLAFRGVNLAQVADALRSANYLYVVPALALIFLGLLARAMSWRTLLGLPIPFGRVFAALNEGYLLNNVLPIRLGELGRAYLISRGRNLTASQAVSSVLVERVVDLCMIVGLLAAFLPVIAGLSWARQAALAAVLVTLTALAGLWLIARRRDAVLHLVRRTLGRLAWGPIKADRWEARAGAFVDGLAPLRDARRLIWAALWSGLAWLSAGLSAWVLLRGFIASGTLAMGFFILVVVGLGIAVPSAPGNIGVWEAAVVGALSVFKVEGSLAISFAIVHHVLNFGLTSLLGGLALAREGETLSQLARSAQMVARGMGRVTEPAETPLP